MDNREKFESFIKKVAEDHEYRFMGSLLNKLPSGDYLTSWVDSAWIGWQAARNAALNEAMEACLKNKILVTHKNQLENDIAYNLSIHDCCADIEALKGTP